MGGNIKLEIILIYPHLRQIITNLLVVPFIGNDSRTQRIPLVTSVRIIPVLAGIHHTEHRVAVGIPAFQQNAFRIALKCQEMDLCSS